VIVSFFISIDKIEVLVVEQFGGDRKKYLLARQI